MDPVAMREFAQLHEMSKTRGLAPAEQARWAQLKVKLIADQKQVPQLPTTSRPISRPG